MLNAGFTTPRQVEKALAVPLLASVRTMTQRDLTVDGNVIAIPLCPALKPCSRYSESLRTLRNGIAMRDADNPPKVIQITSTLPGEGKSTIAASLAVSAAASGLKVLLLDADLRHASASKFFRAQNEKGLVDLLVGGMSVPEVVRFRADVKLWALPAGSKTQNPADLLGADRMQAIVTAFRNSFDLIVIDSPPIAAAIDAVVLSHLADKVVFIVRWAATVRALVQRRMQQIPGHKKIAGVVFNHVTARPASNGPSATSSARRCAREA
jgi:polysaccharide biosynthesis transport protein